MRIDQAMLFTFLCCSPAYSLAVDAYDEGNRANSPEFEAQVLTQTPKSHTSAANPIETAEDWGHWGDQYPPATLSEDTTNPRATATHRYGSGINGSDENLLHRLDQSTLLDYRPVVEQFGKLPNSKLDTKTTTELIGPNLVVDGGLTDGDLVDTDESINNNFITKKDSFNNDLIEVVKPVGLIGPGTIIDTVRPTDFIGPDTINDAVKPIDLIDPGTLIDKVKSIDFIGPETIIDKVGSIDLSGSETITDTAGSIDLAGSETITDTAGSIDLAGSETITDTAGSIDLAGSETIIDTAGSIDLVGPDAVIDKMGSIDLVGPDAVIDKMGSIDLVGPDAVIDAARSINFIGRDTIVDAARSIDLIGPDAIKEAISTEAVIIDLVGDAVD